ncbi:MAG: tetratricopeptide repeat protein [Clostridia bacterium]
MFEKIIFNLFAFTLFILIFLKLIKRNDTSYVYLLVLQFIGIAINFIELTIGKSFGMVFKIIMYVLSVILPLFIIWLEYAKNTELAEIFYMLLAKLAIITGKQDLAKKYLLQLNEKCPNSYAGHKMLAEIYEKNEMNELALEEYEIVYELDSNNKDVYLKIGKLYGSVGREKEAIQIFSNLLKKQPDYYEASMILADILTNQQEYKEAVQVYINALKYRPADYDLYYNIAMTYTMLNDFSKAKENYEKAAQINNALYHAKYSLGQIGLLYGDLDEAEAYFMQCIDTEEIEAGAYYYLARIAMIKGETEKAKNYANIAIEEEPSLFEKMYEENIFLPIMESVNKPKLDKEGKKKNKKKSLTGKEKQIDLHLDKTCKLVGKLNNNDIEMIENVKKTKSEDIIIENEKQID